MKLFSLMRPSLSCFQKLQLTFVGHHQQGMICTSSFLNCLFKGVSISDWLHTYRCSFKYTEFPVVVLVIVVHSCLAMGFVSHHELFIIRNVINTGYTQFSILKLKKICRRPDWNSGPRPQSRCLFDDLDCTAMILLSKSFIRLAPVSFDI